MYGRGVSWGCCFFAAGAKNRARGRYSRGVFATRACFRGGWVFLRVGWRLPLVVWGARAARENRREEIFERNRAKRELRLLRRQNGSSLVGREPWRIWYSGRSVPAERGHRRVRAS